MAESVQRYTHEQLVDDIVRNRSAFRHGFNAIIWEHIEKDAADDDAGRFRALPRIIPDAFALDPEAKAIELFEVEVAHFLSHEKLLRIAEFAFLIATIGWRVTLFRIDVYGRAREEALEPFVRAWLAASR